MKSFFSSVLFLFTILTYAQDYTDIDYKIYEYPNTFSTVQQLVDRVNKDFIREDEKARAFFSWIALNVKFDVTGISSQGFYYSDSEDWRQKNSQQIETMITTVLQNNIATSYGYAVLYDALCKKANIESEVIIGTLKSDISEIGQLPKSANHAWNAVKIDSKWKLVDATLAAGYIGGDGVFKPDFNGAYFFTSPDVFFLNHYPKNAEWLFIPKTKQNFADLPVYYGNYIAAEYRIISPNSGILKPIKNTVTFKFSNLDTQELVSYITDISSTPQVLDQNETTLEYTAQIDSKANYFILVIFGKPVAAYVIRR
ncbi:hypothetical protein GWA97_06915 [Flavobacterium sp. LaA7.5]|nr:hypothetical protein [Flavobacterium salilacus subsp. altitudinum]